MLRFHPRSIHSQDRCARLRHLLMNSPELQLTLDRGGLSINPGRGDTSLNQRCRAIIRTWNHLTKEFRNTKFTPSLDAFNTLLCLPYLEFNSKIRRELYMIESCSRRVEKY